MYPLRKYANAPIVEVYCTYIYTLFGTLSGRRSVIESFSPAISFLVVDPAGFPVNRLLFVVETSPCPSRVIHYFEQAIVLRVTVRYCEKLLIMGGPLVCMNR